MILAAISCFPEVEYFCSLANRQRKVYQHTIEIHGALMPLKGGIEKLKD